MISPSTVLVVLFKFEVTQATGTTVLLQVLFTGKFQLLVSVVVLLAALYYYTSSMPLAA